MTNTIDDNELDRLLGQVRADVELSPTTLARIRSELPTATPVTDRPGAWTKVADTVRAPRRSVWIVAVAASAVTIAIVLLAGLLRPDQPLDVAEQNPVGDPGFAAAVGLMPSLTPEAWERSGELQQQALADGEVTQDEYVAGLDRYRACLNAGGYDFESFEMKGPLASFSLPAAAVDSGVDEPCYRAEWALLDEIWQLQHPDPDAQAVLQKFCLEARGLPSGTTAEETLQLFEESGIPLDECVELWRVSER